MTLPSFRPAAELLEARDSPVILMVVIPPVTLFEVTPIDFTVYADPHHSAEKHIVTRGAEVHLTLSPCLRCDST
jgi:hypothetical protein